MPKRIVITELGGPEVLKYQEYKLPTKLSKSMVRIKQTSIGINFIDTYHRTGIYPLPLEFPICPGLEGAGDVIDVGEDVKNFQIGDRVAYSFSPPLGAYCEIRDFDADKVIKLPESASANWYADFVQQQIEEN